MLWLSSLAYKKKTDKPKERDERQNKKTGPTKLLSWDIMKHNALQTELYMYLDMEFIPQNKICFHFGCCYVFSSLNR